MMQSRRFRESVRDFIAFDDNGQAIFNKKAGRTTREVSCE